MQKKVLPPQDKNSPGPRTTRISPSCESPQFEACTKNVVLSSKLRLILCCYPKQFFSFFPVVRTLLEKQSQQRSTQCNLLCGPIIVGPLTLNRFGPISTGCGSLLIALSSGWSFFSRLSPCGNKHDSGHKSKLLLAQKM